jgi:hypothetical protein
VDGRRVNADASDRIPLVSARVVVVGVVDRREPYQWLTRSVAPFIHFVGSARAPPVLGPSPCCYVSGWETSFGYHLLAGLEARSTVRRRALLVSR